LIDGFARVDQDDTTPIGDCPIFVSFDAATSLATVLLYFGNELLYLGLGQVGAE
jgi:hypothetical protein